MQTVSWARDPMPPPPLVKSMNSPFNGPVNIVTIDIKGEMDQWTWYTPWLDQNAVRTYRVNKEFRSMKGIRLHRLCP